MLRIDIGSESKRTASNQEFVSRSVTDIRCENDSWPMQYLGVPLGGNPRSKAL